MQKGDKSYEGKEPIQDAIVTSYLIAKQFLCYQAIEEMVPKQAKHQQRSHSSNNDELLTFSSSVVLNKKTRVPITISCPKKFSKNIEQAPYVMIQQGNDQALIITRDKRGNLKPYIYYPRNQKDDIGKLINDPIIDDFDIGKGQVSYQNPTPVLSQQEIFFYRNILLTLALHYPIE